jgi:hypothetical protein
MVEWKIINGYPDYAINQFGEVKSLRFNRLLKPSVSGNQYQYVNLVNNKRKKTTAVHKLVIEHFGPLCPDVKSVVDHRDSNKQNNNINNLEWVSISENTLRSYNNQDKKEEARQLRKQGWTLQKIADHLGKSLGFVQDSIHST